MAAGDEIIATPLVLWLAPVGTAFPLLGVAPSGSWTLVGSSGDLSETEDGVTVSHAQTVNEVFAGGSTGPVKAFREKESLKIEVTLMDITLEQYKALLNGNALTTVAAATGAAGYKKMGLSRGQTVAEYALIARGASPYSPAFTAQYQVPRVYQSGDPQIVYKKGAPAGLKLEFTALEDRNASSAAERFGSLIQQHAAPL